MWVLVIFINEVDLSEKVGNDISRTFLSIRLPFVQASFDRHLLFCLPCDLLDGMRL